MAENYNEFELSSILRQMMNFTPTSPPHQSMNEDYMKAVKAISPSKHERLEAAGDRFRAAGGEDALRAIVNVASSRGGAAPVQQGLDQSWRDQNFMEELRNRDVDEWMKNVSDAYKNQFYARGFEFTPWQ